MTFVLAEDKALKTYLSGMTVNDEKQQNRPVKVWYGFPDVEIRSQEFPFVVIELIGVRQAFDRQTSGMFTDTDMQGTVTPTISATVGNTVLYKTYTYEVPIAFDLTYQLATYSRHPLHDRSLIFQMTHKFPSKYGHLPVPNDLNTQTSYRHMFLDSITRRELTDVDTYGARRLHNNVYTVRVMSELTPAQAVAANDAITSVKINKTPLQYSVPNGLQTI